MICLRCRIKFEVEKNPGAILISPPFLSQSLLPKGNIYRKHHLCQKCYGQVIRLIYMYHKRCGGLKMKSDKVRAR